MPLKEQQKIILIGHSLGGRIAIKTIATLAKSQTFIRKVIFLVTAISYKAPEI